MTDLMESMTYMYLQIGVSGLIIVVGLVLLVWYFVKGRKEAQANRVRVAEEYARNGKIIENNTAAINNNSVVIEANTQQRIEEKRQRNEERKCLEALAERITKHGEQLDEIQKQQAICLDRQQRK